MTQYKVVGVTFEGRQEIIQEVIDSYKAKGKLKSWDNQTDEQIIADSLEGPEFEGQVLNSVITLKKEPNNPHDPKAIAVYLQDAQLKKHHIGYIPKEQTDEVSNLMKTTTRIDAEFIGGRYKAIEEAEDDTEYIEVREETIGILISPVDVQQSADNNPFIQKGDGSPKAKMMGRLGCGAILVVLLLIILIIVL